MRFFPIVLVFLAAACSGEEPANHAPQDAASSAAMTLAPLWIATGFSAPEGVAAAPGGGYFISNVAGEGDAKDGEGWISILSEDGEIVETRFAEGLDAPKGMAVLNGALYVADIDTVRRYDAITGESRGEIVIDGAKFLNDATNWQGSVYVSDSATARIFRIDGDSVNVWLADEKLGGVNGLLGSDEKLLISTMDTGSLYEASSTKELTMIADGMIDADGIGIVGGGGWLVSAWRGDIFSVSPKGEVTKLLDTREQEILQNDLSVFGDTVIVPNWRPGTVTAWRVAR